MNEHQIKLNREAAVKCEAILRHLNSRLTKIKRGSRFRTGLDLDEVKRLEARISRFESIHARAVQGTLTDSDISAYSLSI